MVTTLANVNDDLIDETENFAKTLEPREFSTFQKSYLAPEIKAVQFRKLNTVKNTISKSSRSDADDVAPQTLKEAQLDVSEAENLISQSPRNPSVHKASVNEAVVSSVLLSDVMDVILKAPGTPEEVALNIVYQNRELEELSENVGTLEKNLKATESSLKKSEGALKFQDEELKSTRSNLMETETALMMKNQAHLGKD